jgi:hypothetical protein
MADSAVLSGGELYDKVMEFINEIIALGGVQAEVVAISRSDPASQMKKPKGTASGGGWRALLCRIAGAL